MTFKRLDHTKALTSKNKHPWYGFLGILFWLAFRLQEYAAPWEKNTLVLVGIFGPILNGLWSRAKWFKEKEVIGSLEINEYEIIVDDEKDKIPIAQVNRIKLTSNDYLSTSFYWITSSKSAQLRGATEIEVETKDGTFIIFRFVIENKEQWSDFRKVVLSFYKNGVQMEEFLGYRKRAYLLEPFKSRRSIKLLPISKLNS